MSGLARRLVAKARNHLSCATASTGNGWAVGLGMDLAGMQVLDDGNAVQLAPLHRFGGPVRQLTEPRRHPAVTPDQAEVLAIVIAEGLATRTTSRTCGGSASPGSARRG